MITKIIDKNSIYAKPEEFDDLLILRRIINHSDKIVGSTNRSIKKEYMYNRPDKGRRVNIKIILQVERVSLNDIFDRLHIHGTIVESDNESVSNGSHHSIYVSINDNIKLIKKEWGGYEKKLINGNKQTGFLLLSIETGNCGIGILKGTHLRLLQDIYFGFSGKQYKTNLNIEKFFDEIKKTITPLLKKNDAIIIFGPGEIKKKLCNYLIIRIKQHAINVVDGIDSSGEDGIHIFIKSQTMKNLMTESKLTKVANIIDEIMFMVHKKSKKFTTGLVETINADKFNAIESVVFSEKIMKTDDEVKIIKFLNSIEKKGVKVYSVDSTTDIGLRVSGLGGIISVLRFPVGI